MTTQKQKIRTCPVCLGCIDYDYAVFPSGKVVERCPGHGNPNEEAIR